MSWFWQQQIEYDTNTGMSNIRRHTNWMSPNKIKQCIPDYVVVNDWFLPSKDEMKAMYDNLKVFGVGGFSNSYYWTSSEYNSTSIWRINFTSGSMSRVQKDLDLAHKVRPARVFTKEVDLYDLRDIGPYGGYIFYKDNSGSLYRYFEAAPSDLPSQYEWSNVYYSSANVGYTSIGRGYLNTQNIINQIGHIASAAQQCVDYINDNYNPLLITEHNEPKTSTNKTYLIDNSYLNIYDAELKSAWNNLASAITFDNTYANILSPNSNPYIRKVDTPDLVAYDFNFNIPSGATICGIELKITKSAYGMCDSGITFNADEQWYFDNNITHYTYDRLVTIDLNSGCTRTQQFKNYAKPYSQEIISKTISKNGTFLVSPDGYYVFPAIGIWNSTNETSIYGGETDLWCDIYKLTAEDLNSTGFSIVFGATQHVFKGYEENPTFFNIIQKRNWFATRYINGYDTYNMCYQISKLYDIKVRAFYKEPEPIYNMVYRDDIFTSANTLRTYDTYFKFQKCFNGICYSFAKSTNDIYNISLMTGDGKSLNNMYNEYNIIDKYMSNLYQVDVATTNNIDLTITHFIIDGVALKPGHLVLLLNQTLTQENDIYEVSNNYTLKLTNILLTRKSSWRAIFYVKLGSNAGKEFFLKNEGTQFPIIGEEKTFVEGHTWIIKHNIDYDITACKELVVDSSGNTLSNPCKILFTDYAVARTQKETNDWIPYDIYPNSSTTSNIIINYLDYQYVITNQYGELYYTMSGSSSSNTMYNWSGNTVFIIDPTFYSYSQIGDHIIISFRKYSTDFTDTEIFPTGSIFNYLTTIKNLDSNYLTINGEIPGWFFNEVTENEYTFRVRNLHFCNSSVSYSEINNQFANYLNVSPFGELIHFSSLDDKIRSSVIENSDYFRYFDFTTINISVSGVSAYTFDTKNAYQSYKLKPFLENLGQIPVNMYNESYLLSSQYVIEEMDTNWAFQGHTFTDSYFPIQSSLYKIIPNNKAKLLDFKPFTYIDFGLLYKVGGIPYTPYYFTTNSSRTLIYEVTDEYMLIEKPRIDIGISANTFDLINVSKIQDISDILYDIYLNYPHSHYYKYPDNIYTKICSQYALILKENEFVRNLTTGIIYQEDGIFNFDIFNTEIDENLNNIYDVNLTYKPIELIDVGIDKKTKLPYPLELKDLNIKYIDLLWYTGISHDSIVFDELTYHLNTTFVNNELYVNIKYQGIYDFAGNTTNVLYNSNEYLRNDATLVFDANTLVEKDLLYTYFIASPTATVYSYIKDIKIDDYNNKYYIYHTGRDNFSSYLLFANPSATTDAITKIDSDSITSSIYQSHVLMYNEQNEIITAITYKSANATETCVIQDHVTVQNKHYDFVSADINYYTKYNNDGLNNILLDTYYNKKTCAIIAYEQDYKTILWYKKFFASQTNIQDTDTINSYTSNDTSLKIIKDDTNSYLYVSNRIPASNMLKSVSNDGSISTCIVTNNNYNYISLLKISTNGLYNWGKAIYTMDFNSPTDTNHFVKKMLYYEDNVYMLIKAQGRLLYEGVEYGVNNSVVYNDWYLPSWDELTLMYNNLHLSGIGYFNDDILSGTTPSYWSSSEYPASPSNFALRRQFLSGYSGITSKSSNLKMLIRPIRNFTSDLNYNIGDIGPSTGWIFYKVDNLNGTYTYYEVAPNDLNGSYAWSNVTNLSVGTSTSVGSGLANTNAIIAQPGHTTSAAYLASQYSIEVFNNNWNIFVFSFTKDGNLNWVKTLGGNNQDYATDMIVYDGLYGKYLLVSGYYNQSTVLDNNILYCQNTGSYMVKLNMLNGSVVGIKNKTCTEEIYINSMNIVNDSVYISGYYKGSAYFGGNRYPDNFKTTPKYSVFVEEIKINSF